MDRLAARRVLAEAGRPDHERALALHDAAWRRMHMARGTPDFAECRKEVVARFREVEEASARRWKR